MLGGLLLGYGARIAYGCNIGAFVGGVDRSTIAVVPDPTAMNALTAMFRDVPGDAELALARRFSRAR